MAAGTEYTRHGESADRSRLAELLDELEQVADGLAAPVHRMLHPVAASERIAAVVAELRAGMDDQS